MATATENPTATYRLQLTPQFTFDAAAMVVPYLQSLGVSHIYLSPAFEAVPGSEHGYDVTDPMRFRAELGGESGFRRLSDAVDASGLKLILDIVPNHMSASHHNPWWYDVMRFGQDSEYASFFDIDWDAEAVGKLVLPVLGEEPDAILNAGELHLVVSDAGLGLAYFESRFPLSPQSYVPVLEALARRSNGQASERFTEFAHQFEGAISDGEESVARLRTQMEQVAGSVRDDARLEEASLSEDELQSILAAQHYRLEYWRSGLSSLNYRRFFDISGLVGVRVDQAAVFNKTHDLLEQEVLAGRVHGVRVDHVDGLQDPGAYLDRLHALVNPRGGKNAFAVPIYVEKILASSEELPDSWPVSGTTGYEFTNAVNGIFVDTSGLTKLKNFHDKTTGAASFTEVGLNAKHTVISHLFQPELARLASVLSSIGDSSGTRLATEACAAAIASLTAHMSVYRTYSDGQTGVDALAAETLQAAEADLESDNAALTAFRLLSEVIQNRFNGPRNPERKEFVTRWRQLTGAVMGKGVEDTAFYRYAPLASLNEVGGEPGGDNCSVDAFHMLNRNRSQGRLRSLNTTSTHDTKRSEDARARINVLSELADEWDSEATRWMQMNAPFVAHYDGIRSPSLQAELLFYQSLLGIWPIDATPDALIDVADRLAAYMVKAAREAKLETSWHEANRAYEDSLVAFVKNAVTHTEGAEFRHSFTDFAGSAMFHGALNSLSQTVFKLASPGVPDFYQGTELWDLSLVDPDNRRPVNFGRLQSRLQKLETEVAADGDGLADSVARMFGYWRDADIKLWITWRGLNLRNTHADLFSDGDYLALTANGPRAANFCGFLRAHSGSAVIAAGVRLSTRIGSSPGELWGEGAWAGTSLKLDTQAHSEWTDVFTGQTVSAESGELKLAQIFDKLPVALLIAGSARQGVSV